jgi:hypothetical protein
MALREGKKLLREDMRPGPAMVQFKKGLMLARASGERVLERYVTSLGLRAPHSQRNVCCYRLFLGPATGLPWCCPYVHIRSPQSPKLTLDAYALPCSRAIRGLAAAKRIQGDVRGSISDYMEVLEISKAIGEYTGKRTMMICFDRYYKPLIRTKATSLISLPARQVVQKLSQIRGALCCMHFDFARQSAFV